MVLGSLCQQSWCSADHPSWAMPGGAEGPSQDFFALVLPNSLQLKGPSNMEDVEKDGLWYCWRDGGLCGPYWGAQGRKPPSDLGLLGASGRRGTLFQS